VFIGLNLTEDEIKRRLDECLISDSDFDNANMAADKYTEDPYPFISARWQTLNDPFPSEYFDNDHDHDEDH
jgi:hypothetical protein